MYAQSLTTLHQQMQEWLAGPVLAGKLMLGVAEHTAMLHLARMLSAFRRLFPKVELYVEVGMSEALLKKLEKGVLDLVIAQPHADMEHQAVLSRENKLPGIDTCLFKSLKSKSPVTEPFGRFLTEQFGKGADQE